MGNRQELDTISTMSRLIAERRGFEPVIIEGNSDLVGIVTVHDGQSDSVKFRMKK